MKVAKKIEDSIRHNVQKMYKEEILELKNKPINIYK